MSTPLTCLVCAQPMASGPRCSECGTDDTRFSSVRALQPDPRRDRAVVHLYFYILTVMLLFVSTQVLGMIALRWTGTVSPDGLYLWRQLSHALMALWLLFIAVQFSSWPMRIAQGLLAISFLWSVWPWLEDVMGVLAMPERIRSLGPMLTDTLHWLVGIVAPVHAAALLLLVWAFKRIAEHLQLPRARTLLLVAFWLSVVEVLMGMGLRAYQTLEPNAVLPVLSVGLSLTWIGATIVLYRAARQLRQRVRRLTPLASRPSF